MSQRRHVPVVAMVCAACDCELLRVGFVLETLELLGECSECKEVLLLAKLNAPPPGYMEQEGN